MEKFTTHTGVAAPLKRSNVDTDQIIPAVFLKRVTKTGFDDALFHGWRQDPDFVLNQEPYRNASVLVAGSDFGTGSSREHAVWALRDYGFKVVLSPRFADIFRGNSGKQGLVTGIISEADLERFWAAIEAQPGVGMTVDLVALRDGDAVHLEQRADDLDISDVRHVAQRARRLAEQRRHHRLGRQVLRAPHVDLPAQRTPAADLDHFAGARCRSARDRRVAQESHVLVASLPFRRVLRRLFGAFGPGLTVRESSVAATPRGGPRTPRSSLRCGA